MVRRNVQLDHKGRRRNPLSDAGRAYLLVRIAAPTMPHSHAAHAVALYGDKLMYMSDEEMRTAIEGASEAWKAATERERVEADQRANKWESNPETQSHLRLYQGRAMVRADASLERTITELARLAYADLRDVLSWGPNGVVLKASGELDAASAAAVAEVAEVLGREGVRGMRVKMHSKTEALAALLRYYAPEKAAVLTPNNLNIRILVVNADGNALKTG